ncbi:MAG: extracellular solute-binding protein, partial [Clostridia bacterium]|nr:extracellular solute-binding protein [Clostridia bacterium]
GTAEREPEFLTHVFRPESFAIPENYSFNSGIAPKYDAEAGTLTYLAAYWKNLEDENGLWQSETITEIITANAETVLHEEELPLGKDEYLSGGLFTKDVLLCLVGRFDLEKGQESFRLVSWKIGSDGAEPQAELNDMEKLFESAGATGWFRVERMAEDAEGNIYLASQQEVVVLTPALEKCFSVTVPDWIKTMAVAGDGRVWVMSDFGNGQALVPINRETLSFGDPLTLPALPEGVNELFFGPGHDYYYRNDNGLYAADYDESGMVSEELIIDFMNSDISRESVSLLTVYSPEEVLMSDRGESSTVPSIYRKAPDIDLSAVTVLRLVHTGQPEISLAGKIISFNKSHEGVRIVVDSYQSKEDFLGGEKRLAAEMATGTRPDIVITSQSGPALTHIVKHGLFTDLTPFTEREGFLNQDNIMGCVKRTFTDAEDRLFGLTRSFYLQTVVSTDDLLGKYAGRDSWTAEELLDFAESLPSDRLLMEGLTRNSAAYMLLGPGGYASFISEDGKTASFDSELFIRYLKYIASLPTPEEYSAHPPIEGLSAPFSERYQLYHEGKIVLKQKVLNEIAAFLGMELDFGTKNWRMIGQPTNGYSGTAISADSVYVITAADAERQELAWKALEDLFEPDAFSGVQGIPGLVSEFERTVQEYYAYDFAFTFSGNSSRDLKDSYFPLTLTEPGILTEFTEEDERRIRDILDNHCGIPFNLSANDEVTSIVNEEISAFLGGVGTAEDCAKKIQSRVSILLAERG